MPPRKETKPEEPMSQAQVKKYNTLIGKHFIRINPADGKPWPEAKEFFWIITHHFKSTVMHAAGFRIMFQIQKVYRNKFEEVKYRDAERNEQTSKRHVRFNVMAENEEGAMELYAPGDRLIDAELFTKQFAIDKESGEEQSMMVEASANDASEKDPE